MASKSQNLLAHADTTRNDSIGRARWRWMIGILGPTVAPLVLCSAFLHLFDLLGPKSYPLPLAQPVILLSIPVVGACSILVLPVRWSVRLILLVLYIPCEIFIYAHYVLFYMWNVIDPDFRF
jgi:hypothetical protein